MSLPLMSSCKDVLMKLDVKTFGLTCGLVFEFDIFS